MEQSKPERTKEELINVPAENKEEEAQERPC